MSFFSLQEIINKAKGRNLQFKKRMEEASLLSRWPEAVGPSISKHAQAVKLTQGVLWVKVDHPVWKTELMHRKTQLLEKLQALGDPTFDKVTDLKFFDAKWDDTAPPSYRKTFAQRDASK